VDSNGKNGENLVLKWKEIIQSTGLQNEDIVILSIGS